MTPAEARREAEAAAVKSAAETLRRLCGERGFVIARILEADAEGLNRLPHMPRHQADDGAGIDPAREKCAKRHAEVFRRVAHDGN